MLLDLQSHLKPFCEKYASYCASIEKTEENNVIIAICSPASKKLLNHDNENLKNDNSSSFSVHQGIQTLNVESYSDQPQLMSDLHSQSISHCQEGLKAVFDDLLNKVECDPQTFLRPINEFIQNYQSTRKDELVNALKTFSQCSEIAMAVKRTMKCQQNGEVKDKMTRIICPPKRKGNRRKLIRGRPLLQAAIQEPHDFESELPALQIVTDDVTSHELTHHQISAVHDISGHDISIEHDVTVHTPTHPDIRLHPAHLTICADEQRRV